MKLYSFPGSCSTTVYIALLEAGLDFEQIIVDLRGPRHLPDGRVLTDINPKNCLPVLELEDGSYLTEAPAILTYIGDLKPETNLIPSFGTKERTRFVEMFSFLSVDLYKSFRIYRMTQGFEDSFNEIQARMRGYFTYLDGILEGSKFILGETFTVLDAYLINILVGAPKYFDYDLSSYSNVARYTNDMMQRETVRSAYEAVDQYLAGANFKRVGADKP